MASEHARDRKSIMHSSERGREAVSLSRREEEEAKTRFPGAQLRHACKIHRPLKNITTLSQDPTNG